LLAGACSTPPYPPEGRSVAAAPQGVRGAAPVDQVQGGADGMARSSASGGAIPALSGKMERWWPEWSDPANWFLQEQYRL